MNTLASPGSDAGIKHQTQGWARTAQVAMPAKNMPGRKAAFGRRRKEEPVPATPTEEPLIAERCTL